MTKKTPTVGVIAEEDSDVDSIRVLMRRISQNERVGVKRFVGEGCGKIKRKCSSWSDQLRRRGCSLLILIHDLDDRDVNDLRQQIEIALRPCPIRNHLICIPIQELEAWLLSDPEAIKSAMHLRKAPKVKAPPETINSPKEYLGEIILRASKGEKFYLNTKHNLKIAEVISIQKVLNRCPSFVPFHHFINEHLAS